MDKKEFAKLVNWYGDKAQKAADWLINNHSQSFIKSIKQAQYCKINEYLWY